MSVSDDRNRKMRVFWDGNVTVYVRQCSTHNPANYNMLYIIV